MTMTAMTKTLMFCVLCCLSVMTTTNYEYDHDDDDDGNADNRGNYYDEDGDDRRSTMDDGRCDADGRTKMSQMM